MSDLASDPVRRGDGLAGSGAGTPGADPDERSVGWLQRLAEPQVVFPAVALLGLVALWAVTLNLVEVEQSSARRVARASSQELLETYEAQVVRAMGEIDRTLKSLQYAYQLRGDGGEALADLEGRGLLPPDVVFTVFLADAAGDVIAGTGRTARPGVGDSDFFRAALRSDSLAVSRPDRGPSSDWRLRFGRSLTDGAGARVGVAVVEVDAAFFVSGYETSRLGERGVLGLLGTDGVFRVRRTDDRVTAGDRVTYDSVVRPEVPEAEAALSTSPWDGVRRYTSARKLYDLPLAVVVGLSEEEQTAAARELTEAYLDRAAAGSTLLILIIAVLGRTSWKLSRVRRREKATRVAHARRVEHLAFHDALTGLPNRFFLARLLERSISAAHRHDRKLAVLFLDLDGFKEINDTLGHDAGDRLLEEVAGRLSGCLRESDTVARMGGDEFVVLLPEVEEEGRAATVARKIMAALRDPFVLLGQEFRITVSIGISVFPRDGRDEQTLLKNADIAMYRAKDLGKNDFRFFSEEMGSSTLERLNLEARLRRALKEDELELRYRPRRDLVTGRITGVEALLRWRHPELGSLEPPAFLPLAEQTGLVVPIGRWMLKTACRQLAAWREAGLPRIAVAVDVAPRHFFHDGLAEDVASALEGSGMDAELLELEISESVLARDARKAVSILGALDRSGVRLVLDDFGAGYASLAHLRRSPLHAVKIDRSLLRTGGSSVPDRDVVAAVVLMGRRLGSAVVAQGVDTEEQADFLRRQECDAAQGPFFDEPVAAEEVADLLERAGTHLSAGEPAPSV